MMELHSLDGALTYADDMSMEVRYADDTTLLSAMFEKLQLSTTELEIACARWGRSINVNKRKVLSENAGQVYIAGAAVEKVNNFVFLGSVVSGTCGDEKRRVAQASSAFGRLRKSLWSRREVSLKLEVRIFECLIKPIAIYASEPWTLRAEDNRDLLVFQMRCLWSILGVTRRDRRRNNDIRERLGIRNNILDTIRERRLRWFGHVLRRLPESILGGAYVGDFAARRPRGRPPKRWRDQVVEDIGQPLRHCEATAREREDWRELIGVRHRARLIQNIYIYIYIYMACALKSSKLMILKSNQIT